MNDREYFLITSLSYQLKSARRELADFRSGETYCKLRRDYEGIIRRKNLEIKKLRRERDGFSFTRKQITRQWTQVLEDMEREQKKEVKRLKKMVLVKKCVGAVSKCYQLIVSNILQAMPIAVSSDGA